MELLRGYLFLNSLNKVVLPLFYIVIVGFMQGFVNYDEEFLIMCTLIVVFVIFMESFKLEFCDYVATNCIFLWEFIEFEMYKLRSIYVVNGINIMELGLFKLKCNFWYFWSCWMLLLLKLNSLVSVSSIFYLRYFKMSFLEKLKYGLLLELAVKETFFRKIYKCFV